MKIFNDLAKKKKVESCGEHSKINKDSTDYDCCLKSHPLWVMLIYSMTGSLFLLKYKS